MGMSVREADLYTAIIFVPTPLGTLENQEGRKENHGSDIIGTTG